MLNRIMEELHQGAVPRLVTGLPADLDLRLVREGRAVRVTNVLGEESERFEEELLLGLAARSSQLALAEGANGRSEARSDGRGDEPRMPGAADLPLPQRHVWLRHSRRPFRLVQVRDPQGRASWQGALTLYRGRLFGLVGQAAVHKLGPATSEEEEVFALRLLRELCEEQGDVVQLRLMPRRLDLRQLRDFEGRARQHGFHLCEPEGVTRTLVCDLKKSRDELLASMSPKTRRNLRSRDKFAGELRVLDDPAWAGVAKEAVLAAVRRTGATMREGELHHLFHIARERPDLLRIVGLFLPGEPQRLVAFATAHRHGQVAEYASAGSIDEPALRKLPFNYWLLGELFEWARQSGATHFDLGGVTDGGPGDPLAGISEFKRHLTNVETESGREMLLTLQPGVSWALTTLRALRDRVKA